MLSKVNKEFHSLHVITIFLTFQPYVKTSIRINDFLFRYFSLCSLTFCKIGTKLEEGDGQFNGDKSVMPQIYKDHTIKGSKSSFCFSM